MAEAQPVQTFGNHAYRPAATLVGAVLAAFAFGTFVSRVLKGDHSAVMLALLSLSAAVLALLYMSRVYTTRLQDRIIRLEMRVRAASMLSPEQQQLLNTLGIKHIAALRFASDAELSMLLERAVREKLPPSDIKRAVAAWVADHHRT
ncbi:MAG: DUF6526 family protein [Acidobacteriota bacterium]